MQLMTPSEYLSSLKPEQRRELAERMGTSVAFLRNVQYGTRKLNEVYAMRLEALSNGQAPRQLALPEAVWRELWPELPELHIQAAGAGEGQLGARFAL